MSNTVSSLPCEPRASADLNIAGDGGMVCNVIIRDCKEMSTAESSAGCSTGNMSSITVPVAVKPPAQPRLSALLYGFAEQGEHDGWVASASAYHGMHARPGSLIKA